MSQFIRFFAGKEHPFDASLVQRSDVDVQSAADCCDIFDIIRLITHDRAAAAGEQYVCHVIHCDIVRDVVHKWHIVSYIRDAFSKHGVSSLSNHLRSGPCQNKSRYIAGTYLLDTA